MRATLFFLDNPEPAGVFNVGMGVARSWLDLARAMFAALEKPEHIEFIDMPDGLKNQYQYFTQANIKKLTVAGFDSNANYRLEDAVKEYVTEYLQPHMHLGESS